MATITRLVAQGKNPDRANLYVDGAFFCAISKVTALQHGLRVGVEIDEQQLHRIVFDSDKDGAFTYALNYISRYAPTCRKLTEKLYEKGYGQAVVTHVIEQAKRYRYIDDAQWAQSYVALHGKIKGKTRLRAEMKAKGIDDATIEQALQGMQGETFFDGALQAARKHARGQDLDDPAYRAKLGRFLTYRGYSWEEINDCIRILREENKA